MSQHITSLDTYRLLGRSGLRASPLSVIAFEQDVNRYELRRPNQSLQPTAPPPIRSI
jgi:hypothetical protein